MRLLLVTETFPPDINGVAMTLSRLTGELRGRGHEVKVIRPGVFFGSQKVGVNGDELTVPGLRIPNYPEARIGLATPGRMLGLLQSWRPDLVHIATEGPLGWSALKACEKLGLPVISTFHTNFHDYTHHYGLSFLEQIVEGYLRSFHNRTRANLVPDKMLIDTLEKSGFRNNHHFGRGVDTRLFDPARRDNTLRRQWAAEERDPVIVHISRIAAEKNIPLVLACYHEMKVWHPGLKMVLVGDGPLRPRLQRMHPDVIFCGMKLGEDLARHYASGDFFLFASETETFGNVVTEAMASGLAVLAYDYAAGRQFIRSGENGFTVALGRNDDFREAAHRLLDVSSGLQVEEVRRAARETALQIPWSGVVDVYERITRSVLQSAPA